MKGSKLSPELMIYTTACLVVISCFMFAFS